MVRAQNSSLHSPFLATDKNNCRGSVCIECCGFEGVGINEGGEEASLIVAILEAGRGDALVILAIIWTTGHTLQAAGCAPLETTIAEAEESAFYVDYWIPYSRAGGACACRNAAKASTADGRLRALGSVASGRKLHGRLHV